MCLDRCCVCFVLNSCSRRNISLLVHTGLALIRVLNTAVKIENTAEKNIMKAVNKIVKDVENLFLLIVSLSEERWHCLCHCCSYHCHDSPKTLLFSITLCPLESTDWGTSIYCYWFMSVCLHICTVIWL